MNIVVIPILALVVILNFIIGIVILSRGFANRINFLFGLISLIVSAWAAGILGFYTIKIQLDYLWIIETHSATALIAALFVLFTLNFPNLLIKKRYIRLLTLAPFFIIIFYLFFTDNIIGKVYGIKYEINSGYIFYSLYIILYFCLGYFLLFLQYKKSLNAEQKIQVAYVLTGAILSGLSAALFDLVLPYFDIFDYNWLGPFFTFFLVGAIAYAILKHHLFDIKVIATELITFSIWIILLVKTVSSNGLDLILNLAILISLIIFGYFLIRSVIKEVKQREELEKLSKEVQEAYEKENKVRVQDEALLGSIGDGVVAIDSVGKIMFANKAAEEMLGLKNSEMIGRSYEQILAVQNENGEKIAEEESPLYKALNSGKKIITDATEDKSNTIFYYAKKDGTKFPVAITAAPVILDGKTIGAIDVFRDVTIERQIDKAKSEFVSIASHQLRTPLTAIRWYAEYLMGGKAGKLTKKQKEYMDAVYSGNLRMIKLINMMLNISRLEAGKIKVNKVSTDMKSLLEDIIKEQQFDVDVKKQKLVFECKEKLPEISTDPALIRQVFQNLLSNAIKYTPEGGKIVLSAQKKDEKLSFEVQDNGIGIPENQQNKMFQKLFRADNAMESSAEGTGLGLYGAKMTAEQLGGKIWFESKVGKGTTFFVELPIN